MRLPILTLALTACLASAGAALAGGVNAPTAGGASPAVQMRDTYRPGGTERPAAQDHYAERLAMLRKKVLRTSAEDGGNLSPEHYAALKQELDAINDAYASNAPPRPGTFRR